MDYSCRERAEGTAGTYSFLSPWLNLLKMPGKLWSLGCRMPKVIGPSVSVQIWKCYSEHAITACPGAVGWLQQADGRRGQWKEGSEVFSFQHLYLYIKVPFMNTHCVGRPFINSIMAPNHPPNCKNINFYLLNSVVVYFLLFCGLRSVKECKGITLVCTGTKPKQALPQLCFLCLVRHSR